MPAISPAQTVYPSNVHIRLSTQYAKIKKTIYLGSIQRKAVTFLRFVISKQGGDQALKRRMVALKPKFVVNPNPHAYSSSGVLSRVQCYSTQISGIPIWVLFVSLLKGLPEDKRF